MSNLRGSLVAAAVGLLLTAGGVEAQFPLVIVAGPTFSTIATDDFDTSIKIGFFAGVGTAFEVNENVSISPFAAFVQKGAKFKSGGEDDGEDTYNYLEIPVFFRYGMPMGETATVTLAAGPQLSFMLSCTEAVPGLEDYDCKDYDDFAGSTDFGLVGSVSVGLESGVSFGGGFDLGLKDIFDEIDGGYKNRGFYLFGSYAVMLGSS